MKCIGSLSIAIGLIFSTILFPIMVAENIEPVESGSLGNSIINTFIRQGGNESEPQPINLHFNGGDGGELKAGIPEGNSTTNVPCPGSPLPRAFGLLVGIWTTTDIKAPIVVNPSISCSIWAKSDVGASNVRFNCQILHNGADIMDIYTNSQSVSSTPVEFTGDNNREEGKIDLQPGDTLGARVYYFAESQYFIGPAPDSTMIVGGIEHDTHITITTAPISIMVKEPIVTENIVTFSADYIDAFSSSRLHAHITVNGIVDAVTLSEPIFSLGGNGSSVSWNWDYKIDKAKDGEYRIVVFLCYGDENEFMGQGSYMLNFPKTTEDEGFITSLGILFPIMIIAIIAVVVVIGVKVILNRRALKSAV